ncbi:MAG: ABC transporter substrate-binding protein [Pseudonocardiales bacterium]|nr:MAG: ABC transporter substrate-binding protein [Pseudonocardiales bacterium]
MRRSRQVTTIVCCVALSALLAGCVAGKKTKSDPTKNAKAKDVSLTINANDVVGGKNAAEANWINSFVIPGFQKMEKAKGINATVKFNGAGVDDEQYKTKLELNLKTGNGADVFAADGIWLGELASAGYVKPLDQVVGPSAATWDGWSQINKSVQQNLTYKDKLYGIPNGTDGRVIYFNKTLFGQAGLPAAWQPKSWADILSAGQALKRISGVNPIQINAGTPMGEATTAQGFLPLLAGTGKPLFDEATGKWQGASSGVKDVLNFYKQIYGAGLGDPKLQQDKAGRDESFANFSKGKIGILIEGDYFWRSIICPDKKTCNATAMANRNSVVGYAKIPAEKPGMGVKGQDFVSVSGGGGWMLNPGTKFPQQAWELMTYMVSAEAQNELAKAEIRISPRDDVNATTLANDPLLSYISKTILPITTYRPSDQNYNPVSVAIQQATADVVSGKSASTAANTYQSSLQKAVGDAHVETG